MGSNPLHSFVATCNSSTPQIFSTSSSPFIITDIIHPDQSYTSYLRLSTSSVTLVERLSENNYNSPIASFNTRLVRPANEALFCNTDYTRSVTISGYYTHP
jgi:hypothetical protein